MKLTPQLTSTLLLSILASLARADNSTSSGSILSFDTVQQPDIDYESFNDKLSILGDFDSISFYEYEGQSNTTSTTDQSSLYLINNQNQFKALYQYNGTITQFEKLSDDSILLIGEFQLDTSGNYSSPVIFNTTTNQFLDIKDWQDHVSGDIMTTFYDKQDNLIYFGGDLSYDDEVYGLVIYDLSKQQIVDSPFRGFNEDSSVNSILKIADKDEGSIIFGGHFNNLGDKNLLKHRYSNHTITHHNHTSNSSNTSVSVDPENVVSLKYAVISSVNTDRSTSDADNLIICPDNEANWLLNDQNVGSWSAALPFEVYPTKLRLYNSLKQDSGVEYFRIITSPTNGIMNLSYINPINQKTAYCDAWCPLLNVTYLEDIMNELDKSFYSINSTRTTGTIGFGSKYQEFEFVNSVSVSSVTVQVMSSYGNQAGLSGFQLYESGIVTYANDTLNEPNCGDDGGSSALSDLNGGTTWSTFKDQDGTHLMTTVQGSDITSNKVGVTFYPNVTYSGNYSVLMYTPGCNYDNTCSSRGIVNVTLTNGDGEYLTSRLIYQNNEEEKYDTIYTGHLDVEDGVPYVDMTLNSAITSGSSEVVLVADRVQLNLLSVDQIYYYNNTNSTTTRNSSLDLTIPINGLFEYSLANFSSFDNSMSNVSTNGTTNVYVGNSTINLVGSQILSKGATVNGLAIINNTLFVAGDFESEYGDNFIGLSLQKYNETSNSTSVSSEKVISGGVNGVVNDIFLYDNDSLIIVGDFNKTLNSTTINKLNSTVDQSSILNIAEYDGSWYSFTNGSNSNSIDTFTNLTFNGVEYFIFNGDNSSVEVWDNTHDYWDTDSNLNLSLAVKFTNYTIAAGKMSYMSMSDAKGGAYVSDPHLSSLPFELSGNSNNYYTALYLNDSVSVFGGQFNTTDGIQNLIFVDSDHDNRTYGIEDLSWDYNSKVISLLNTDEKLFIGLENGATIGDDHHDGLIIYELSNTTLSVSSIQPLPLSNDNGVVRANALVASSDSLYVGGEFTQAGSLSCSGICSYDLDASRWSNPLGTSLSGPVYKMAFYSSEKILVSGNLTINNQQTNFAIFDTKQSSVVLNSQLNSGLDIPIKNFILVDQGSITNRIIAMSDNYLGYFNGSTWNSLTNDIIVNETSFKDIQLVDLNSKNTNNDQSIFNNKQILMVSGSISHKEYGNFSTGFYNGTSWIPYLFTNSNSSTNSVLQNKSMAQSSANYSLKASVMKARNVVGVAFACALGSLLICVLSYCLYYFLIGKNNNYHRPLEARVAEKDMLETVPPNQLIDSLDQAKYLAE